jgi:tetratricopeptide (TPR) repeat protein
MPSMSTRAAAGPIGALSPRALGSAGAGRLAAWGNLVLTLFVSSALATHPAAARASDEHEALLSQADRALEQHRYGEAARCYRRAAVLTPRTGEALVMAAVAEFQLGQYGEARADLARAQARGLATEDRELAQTYLGLIAEADAQAPQDDRDSGFAATISTSVGGGYDSNPNRSGVAQLDSEAAAGLTHGSSFGTATLDLGVYGTPLPNLQLDLDYTLDQSTQIDRSMAGLDYQDHALEMTVRHRLGEGVRLDLAVAGELSFTGTATVLTAFSNSARAQGDLILGAGKVQLRLGAGFQTTAVLDPALTFLSGQRFEIRATPIVTWEGWRLSAIVRLRAEELGTARSEPGAAPEIWCGSCNVATVVPYSNRSASLSARIKGPSQWRLQPGASARLDRRWYGDLATLERSDADAAATDLGRRATETRALGADLRLRLTETISLKARWDFSRFVGAFHPLSAEACAGHEQCGQGLLANRQYDKHALGLQLEIEWL